MATGDYLKTAAASLRSAAVNLQQQAKEMQANLTRLKSDKHSVIDKNQREIKTKQVEVAVVRDIGHKSHLSTEIQKLQDEIIAAEQQVRQAESDVQRAVKVKLDSAAGIENQAKQLESQAGNMD
jgi:hypothetical protein